MRICTRSIFLALVVAGTAAGSWAADGKWEKDIQAFEANDRTNRPPANAILFVGSSSIRLWTNLAGTFPEWTVIRRGFGGSRISDVNGLFDRLVLAYKPAKIVLYAGENDIAAGASPGKVFEEFKSFAGKVRKHLPGTEIYFLSMKPSPSRWHLSPQINEGNQSVKRYARFRPDITYVDVGTPLLTAEGRPDSGFFVKDQLHLNPRGYEIWAREIRQAVKE
jgi:lysophospholipase L1-like esterase